jgi:hypothetical protein
MGVNAKTGKPYKPKSATYYVRVQNSMDTLPVMFPPLAVIAIDAGSSEPELSYGKVGSQVSISLKDFADILKTITDPYQESYNTPEALNRVILILLALDRLDTIENNKLLTKEELALFESSKLSFAIKVKALKAGVTFEELMEYDDLNRDQIKSLFNI